MDHPWGNTTLFGHDPSERSQDSESDEQSKSGAVPTPYQEIAKSLDPIASKHDNHEAYRAQQEAQTDRALALPSDTIIDKLEGQNKMYQKERENLRNLGHSFLLALSEALDQKGISMEEIFQTAENKGKERKEKRSFNLASAKATTICYLLWVPNVTGGDLKAAMDDIPSGYMPKDIYQNFADAKKRDSYLLRGFAYYLRNLDITPEGFEFEESDLDEIIQEANNAQTETLVKVRKYLDKILEGHGDIPGELNNVKDHNPTKKDTQFHALLQTKEGTDPMRSMRCPLIQLSKSERTNKLLYDGLFQTQAVIRTIRLIIFGPSHIEKANLRSTNSLTYAVQWGLGNKSLPAGLIVAAATILHGAMVRMHEGGENKNKSKTSGFLEPYLNGRKFIDDGAPEIKDQFLRSMTKQVCGKEILVFPETRRQPRRSTSRSTLHSRTQSRSRVRASKSVDSRSRNATNDGESDDSYSESVHDNGNILPDTFVGEVPHGTLGLDKEGNRSSIEYSEPVRFQSSPYPTSIETGINNHKQGETRGSLVQMRSPMKTIKPGSRSLPSRESDAQATQFGSSASVQKPHTTTHATNLTSLSMEANTPQRKKGKRKRNSSQNQPKQIDPRQPKRKKPLSER
ncbi:SubName: Full=Uncharacterized protein {ECO:0000313/EMBL:CCA75930.1} [Serendipita indica DSM 11827]|uniref:Uncharacterized protein n=1 Tax=Serendipita indica (strain DSM 11827) TaxID=1109443 RepID=G4TX87_SERID|nr:SubName: Full=Uncharacterized protein {ECO:0000313/EMBL:CCA75930.1} [Serendipita indica DSM 11827]CCA75930.1 hypothetical protein PIIN_09926 [Serendipita indica DSM 11827]